MQPRRWAWSLAGGQLLLPSESRQSWVVWTVKSNASIDSEIGTASLDSPLVLGWGPAMVTLKRLLRKCFPNRFTLRVGP